MFLVSVFFLLISFNSINTKMYCTKREDFQAEIEGKKVDLYYLMNNNGYEISITNYGGIIVSILVPNTEHKLDNIVHGYPTLQEYILHQKKGEIINSLLGRYSNEIKDGEFILDNQTYKLKDLNNYSNFGEKVWTAVQINSKELRLYYTSEDGENGFPGKLHVEVVYTLNDDNEFKISYTGITTKKTVVNLSQRLFINLYGNINGEIKNHILSLNSKLYLPTDENKIPLGDIKLVDNTIYDLRNEKKIGEKNLDNYFILDKNNYNEMGIGAFLQEKKSGRILKIFTTQPGLNIFSDNYGISIEPMHFPDSPNIGFFPSTILEPGKVYRQETIYKFEVRKD